MTRPGPIALLGGGEHLPPCEPIDRRLMALTGVGRPRVVVIPTAASDRQMPRTAALARNHWQRLGAASVALVLAGQSEPRAHEEAIGTADVIVLPGGHPDRLMRHLAASPLFDAIYDRWLCGAALSGSSAGAMCMFRWQLRLYPPNPLKLQPGLGLLDNFLAAPHFDRLRARRWASWAARWLDGVTVLGIDESTGVVGTIDDLRVLGAGSVAVVDRQVRTEYRSGERVHIEVAHPFLRRAIGTRVQRPSIWADDASVARSAQMSDSSSLVSSGLMQHGRMA